MIEVGGTVIGFVCVGVAILCFGSNFVPVKKYETGDGMFFQWVLCSAIWFSGLIVNIVRTNYFGLESFISFYPFAMLGGFLWATGNIMVVTIIKCIGLGLGMCLWGATNLLMGWASGSFGLFGLHKQEVPHPTLNYVGVSLAVVGVILFVFVKSETQKDHVPAESRDSYGNTGSKNATAFEDEYKYLLSESIVNSQLMVTPEQRSWVEKLNGGQRRIIGIVLAIISGFFYGVNFDPPQYISDHSTNKNGLDYVFSHFCGIYATSTLYFTIYCISKRNNPIVFPNVILPALISGCLWAIADICWFVANAELQMVISFPLIATGPGLVASLWGILVFKEIRGARNILILATAFAITIVAVTLIALSKK